MRPDQLVEDRGHQRGDLFLHPSDAELGWRPAGHRVSFLLGVHNGRPGRLVCGTGSRRTRVRDGSWPAPYATTSTSGTGPSPRDRALPGPWRAPPPVPVTLVRAQSSLLPRLCAHGQRRDGGASYATGTRSQVTVFSIRLGRANEEAP